MLSYRSSAAQLLLIWLVQRRIPHDPVKHFRSALGATRPGTVREGDARPAVLGVAGCWPRGWPARGVTWRSGRSRYLRHAALSRLPDRRFSATMGLKP